jgi:L-seryl-tRNA(Ser) seleniumtransferase
MNEQQQQLLRQLPKVDKLLTDERIVAQMNGQPRRVVVSAVQRVLDEVRQSILSAEGAAQRPFSTEAAVSQESLVARIIALVEEQSRPTPRRVINATGIIVNTGLGRSLLSDRAVQRLVEAATMHSALEVDVETGERGHRDLHIANLICRLTGAEMATVVNNNAGAVLIALNELADGKEVIVSRGELVEIGGSFRIPDVMSKSGAQLVEVGTTNKTRVSDYEKAITENTALLLKVHTSNFRVVGFTESASAQELVALGARHKIPMMEDLGSGAFVDVSRYGIAAEPLVQESIAAGADVVTFSGDKLLGGPQAGLIAGKKAAVHRIRRNPLYRALRCDKLTIAALEGTLRAYFDPEQAVREIPTLQAISVTLEELNRRARRLKRMIEGATRDTQYAMRISIENGTSQVGGGALPTEFLPTRLVALRPTRISVDELNRRLRLGEPSVFARIQNDALLLDMRTVRERELKELTEAVEAAILSDEDDSGFQPSASGNNLVKRRA